MQIIKQCEKMILFVTGILTAEAVQAEATERINKIIAEREKQHAQKIHHGAIK